MANKEQKGGKEAKKAAKATSSISAATSVIQTITRKENKTKRGQTAIKKCSCLHEYQDLRYGPGNRVFNAGGAPESLKWRCTVCGQQKY